MPAPDSLLGLHHVSALTGQVDRNLRFYTEVLGLRLVLKTVNQDDTSSYHLFYGDETGSPGTDVTFFDVPHARQKRPGTGLISGISLRVRGREALEAWADRLDENGVRRTTMYERAGRAALTLYDEEGQTIHLVNDANERDQVPDTVPWTGGGVHHAMAIRGLGPVEVTVEKMAPTRRVLTEVLGFTERRPLTVESPAETERPIPTPDNTGEAAVFDTGPGGVAAELHVVERPNDPQGWVGVGGVHHLALRTPNSETIRAWRERVAEAGLNITPVIDRHYFESAYVREPGGILIEIATDTGARFPIDEAASGALSLPPELEPRRESIEESLTPIGSTSSQSAS